MGRLIREKDWSSTPLGAISSWPASLVRYVGTILDSRFPMFVWWGKDLLCFYNDAYRPSLGKEGKHPNILGRPAKEAWPEIWDFIKPRISLVLEGRSFYKEDEYLPIYRNGKLEDVYWTFNYSPIKNDEGDNEGVLVVCIETTDKVNAYRKLENQSRLFRDLVSAAPIPIGVYLGENLVVDTVNDAILKTWDKDRSVIGKTFRQALPELEGQPFFDILAEVYQTGIAYHTDNSRVDLLYKGRMQTFYFNFTYTPLKNGEGEVYGILNTANDITQLVTIQQKLEESERNFRNMILQSPVAMCILTGPEFVVKVVNEGVLERWGKKLHDVINKPVFEGLPEAREQGLEALLTRVYETGETFIANELPINLPKEGVIEPKYLNFTYQPLIVEGKVVGVMASAVDVTAQVIARKNIEETNRQLQVIADAIPQKLWTSSKSGRFQYFNQLWSDYTGLSLEELKENGWESCIHPGERAAYKRQWQHSVSTGENFEIETRLLNKEGMYRWHLCRGTAIKDVEGNITTWIGSHTDIHLQKTHSIEMEEAVQQRTRELLIANESLQQKNQEIALSKYNKRFLTEFSEKFSGIDLKSEFFNSLVLYISDLTRLDYVLVGNLEERDSDFYINTIALAASGKLADNFSYDLPDSPCEKVIRNTEFLFPNDCHLRFSKHAVIKEHGIQGYIGYPLFDEKGKPIGIISVLHTEPIEDAETVSSILKIVAKRAEVELHRVRYEEALRQSNLALEEKNHELEMMNDELKSFAYVSSHDLQEPLRKIRIFCNRLVEREKNNLSPSGLDLFERVQNAATRMQTLIEDLLAYSRTNATEKPFELVSIDQLVQEVSEDMNEQITESNALVEFKNLGKASVIPFQFKQLCQNLIANSIKFARPGLIPVIKISSTKVKGDKDVHPKLKSHIDYLKVSFTDNGIGFRTEFNDRIFDVFQRLHGKDAYPGTGIGLAIVKKIVENHSGVIFAEGVPEKGASFHIFLPDNLSS